MRIHYGVDHQVVTRMFDNVVFLHRLRQFGSHNTPHPLDGFFVVAIRGLHPVNGGAGFIDIQVVRHEPGVGHEVADQPLLVNGLNVCSGLLVGNIHWRTDNFLLFDGVHIQSVAHPKPNRVAALIVEGKVKPLPAIQRPYVPASVLLQSTCAVIYVVIPFVFRF